MAICEPDEISALEKLKNQTSPVAQNVADTARERAQVYNGRKWISVPQRPPFNALVKIQRVDCVFPQRPRVVSTFFPVFQSLNSEIVRGTTPGSGGGGGGLS